MMTTYNRLPIVVERGEGNYLYDENGKKYLDLFTGLAVNILGHSHPAVIKTLKDQGEKFLHISNVFLNKPAIELAEKLIAHSINGKVFFTNSGAEATEAALKLIHKWSKEQTDKREGVVVLKKSFHGRTLGALKLTRQPSVYQDFPATTMSVFEVEAHDVEALELIIKEKKPAAVIMEPVLGSGGIVPLEPTYLEKVASLCKMYGVLCCMDEIQTGVGRTGEFFAYQHAKIQPDLILFAKGIGGGLPLGGIIVSEALTDLFKPGDHGTTFAPSPLSAALGNTVIDELYENGQLNKSQEISTYLWDSLASLKVEYGTTIDSVRGKGMMLGIVLNAKPESAKEIQRNMLNEGILIDVTQQTILRLLPPLTLLKSDVDFFVKTLKKNLEILGLTKAGAQ
ncbi:aspartate aminotransferase family protein [Bacillus solitudinis]|uniref:aspartate aminotransferase family protein n=1 Tax=Bacillus solitudinis TaxID=2014074 RepID=UPI000C25140A